MKTVDAHNEAVQRLVKEMWVAANREPEALMVLCESLLVGVCMFTIKLGGDEAVLEVMMERARERLAELRLADLETEGRS